MNCIHHGKKVDMEEIGPYRMCRLTGLPCPNYGVMAFSEESVICQDPDGCFFVNELFKIDPELTPTMDSKK